MRAIMRVALCVAALLSSGVSNSTGFAAPARGGLGSLGQSGDILLVEDTCWWWGVRWQYGWRGYAWYPCWDWPKPQIPEAVAPEAMPYGTPPRQPCSQKSRDTDNGQSRREC